MRYKGQGADKALRCIDPNVLIKSCGMPVGENTHHMYGKFWSVSTAELCDWEIGSIAACWSVIFHTLHREITIQLHKQVTFCSGGDCGSFDLYSPATSAKSLLLLPGKLS